MAPVLGAQRAIDVLRFLAVHPDERFTLSELAAELGIGLASLHGVLDALESGGFLERHPKTKTYRLGPEAVVLGSAARTQHGSVDRALRVAAELAREYGLSAAVISRLGEQLVVLEGVGPRLESQGFSTPGRRFPLVAPLGSVLLASSPPQEILAWLQRAGLDAAGDLAATLRHSLDVIAERGWMVARLDAITGDPADDRVVRPEALATYLVDDDPGQAFHPHVVMAVLPGSFAGASPAPDLALALTNFGGPESWDRIVVLGEDLVARAHGSAARPRAA